MSLGDDLKIETKEQKKGLFARLKERYNKWREQQDLKKEEAIKTKAREALVKAQQEAEKRREIEEPIIERMINADVLETLREIGETDEIENNVIIGELNQPEVTRDFFSTEPIEPQGRKGLRGWLRDALQESMQDVLLEDIDREIRKESRSSNYLNLSNDSYGDAVLFAQEEKAIDNAFEKNREDLEECYSQEEIYDLYQKFQERAKLYDEVRREGIDVRVGKIARLKTLETYFGVKSSESIRYLDALEVEIKAKQRIRGLDKKIANEYQLDINDGRERVSSEEARSSEEVRSSEEAERPREMPEYSRWDSDQYREEMNELVEAGEQEKVERPQFSRWDSDQYREEMNELVEAGEQEKVERPQFSRWDSDQYRKSLADYLNDVQNAREKKSQGREKEYNAPNREEGTAR